MADIMILWAIIETEVAYCDDVRPSSLGSKNVTFQLKLATNIKQLGDFLKITHLSHLVPI